MGAKAGRSLDRGTRRRASAGHGRDSERIGGLTSSATLLSTWFTLGHHEEQDRAYYYPSVEETAGWEGTVHFAAWRGDPATVAQLISEGVDVNAPGPDGRTPLMEAVDEPGDFFDGELAQVVQLLLGAGASVSAVDDKGWTAVHHGTRAGLAAIHHSAQLSWRNSGIRCKYLNERQPILHEEPKSTKLRQSTDSPQVCSSQDDIGLALKLTESWAAGVG
jgi:hypothetical protein